MGQWTKSILLEQETATEQAGVILAGLVRPGDVLALVGDLGAGKTTFTRSLAKGMLVDRPNSVCSPTFTIVNEYPGPLPLYHIDLYRIGDQDEAWELGLDEYFFGQGVCVVEWFDRFPKLQPRETLEIRLDFLDDLPDGRRVTARARGPRALTLGRAWFSKLTAALG